MKKIISLFVRDKTNPKLVTRNVTPGAEWVVEGQGIATRKFDGTCCMVRDGVLYKRYDGSKSKLLPPDFVPAYGPEDDGDPEKTHWLGWLPIGDRSEDQYHKKAWARWLRDANGDVPPDGTYELCGEKVQSNPEHINGYELVRHGIVALGDAPRTFDELKAWLATRDIEGIVWHHQDGRMVKIKAKDFGIRRSNNSITQPDFVKRDGGGDAR